MNMTQIPSKRYSVTLDTLQSHAKEIGNQIGSLIADKALDPDNLVILVGEQHDQFGHKFFEAALAENLHQQIALRASFTELPKHAQETMNGFISLYNAKKNSPLKAVIKTGFMFSLSDVAFQATAKFNKIPCYGIDMERGKQRFSSPASLSKDFYSRWASDPYYEQIFIENKSMFETRNPFEKLRRTIAGSFFEGSSSGVSQLGVLKRDLYMMDQIDQHMTERKGPALGILGRKHTAKIQDENPTISNLLLHNKTDIVTIHLATSAMFETPDTIEKAWEIWAQKIDKDSKNHYHAHFQMDIPFLKTRPGDPFKLLKANEKSAETIWQNLISSQQPGLTHKWN